MAKKITLLMIVMLLVSALVFVSCSQGTVEKKDPYTPPVLEAIENKLGTVGDDNLVFNGDFETGTVSFVTGDGASATIVAAGEGNNALSVKTAEKYGCIYVDITDYYGRGKSYYIEAKAKNDGTDVAKDLTAQFSFTICSGAVEAEATKQKKAGHNESNGPGYYYNYDEIYGAPAFDDTEGIFLPIEGDGEPANLKDGNWHTLAAILAAEEIDSFLAEQTAKYKATEQTMSRLYVCFYVGVDGKLDNYSYLVDDFVIKDLNSELPIEGKTYVPEDEPEPDDGTDDGADEDDL